MLALYSTDPTQVICPTPNYRCYVTTRYFCSTQYIEGWCFVYSRRIIASRLVQVVCVELPHFFLFLCPVILKVSKHQNVNAFLPSVNWESLLPSVNWAHRSQLLNSNTLYMRSHDLIARIFSGFFAFIISYRRDPQLFGLVLHQNILTRCESGAADFLARFRLVWGRVWSYSSGPLSPGANWSLCLLLLAGVCVHQCQLGPLFYRVIMLFLHKVSAGVFVPQS